MNTLTRRNVRPHRSRRAAQLALAGALAGLALTASHAARAEDGNWPHVGSYPNPWYINADVGRSRVSSFNGGISGGDKNDTTWGANLGYQINRNFAVELNYRDFGEFNVSNNLGSGKWKADGWGLSAVGILPMDNRWSLYGKVGAFYADVRPGLPGVSGDKETNGTVGLGASYDFGNRLIGKLEWDYYRSVGNSSSGKPNINTYTVGIGYRF